MAVRAGWGFNLHSKVYRLNSPYLALSHIWTLPCAYKSYEFEDEIASVFVTYRCLIWLQDIARMLHRNSHCLGTGSEQTEHQDNWNPTAPVCQHLREDIPPFQPCRPFPFCTTKAVLWRGLCSKDLRDSARERHWNHNNTSVSRFPSWGSWVELISHNISKQTVLASLTHTAGPNWVPGVLRL